jgi:hypothetical protein
VFWYCADDVVLVMASEQLIAVGGAEDEVDDEEENAAASADQDPIRPGVGVISWLTAISRPIDRTVSLKYDLSSRVGRRAFSAGQAS